jgi:hypothetical protein
VGPELCQHPRVADAEVPNGRPPKVIRLRYAGVCRECNASVPAGSRATYYPATRGVVCGSCLPVDGAATAGGSPEAGSSAAALAGAAVESGTAGASARQEYERRVAKREQRIREAHPRIGGFLLAVTDEPQSTTAWQRGARR